ncbi:hypothetical protein RO3G_15404 [Rhizopus delemar RA 99-880]|uniref:Uncharacterized protein n=1 Tax=Rhizopus delemar (strain RA 99-880 / ATCC MYA-4621 / FGSC 9543 / NRRL 43880) TaxID=246409 RepID=I1CQG3_RHIO9|nr:hypothetical protein RO3G_15404 [Rhizopus delemar RA 99-880]|eukprot:EIE90693.1 hypothetical protein RO3G_15404 [Rhizopus delemar RA 99-880]
MVTCRISDPSIVEFTRKNDHHHIPGPTLVYNLCQFRILCEMRSKIACVKDLREEKVLGWSAEQGKRFVLNKS